MNILVTGANGQLGTCLHKAVQGSADHYVFTDLPELDITDAQAVAEAMKGKDVVINCAAYTNVDRAETDLEVATMINATAVGILARAAKEQDAFMFHISTDYVFGGNKGNTPRSETEPVNPTGVYGRSKLKGEQQMHSSGCKGIIMRTAWLYSEYGHNFVKTMLSLTSSKPSLKVVFDQVGTPTYAQDLADAIVHIISHRNFIGHEGTYHFSNEGVCSWYDFAQEIASLAGNHQCQIEPCHSDEFPSPVVRPPYSVLDKTLFKKTFSLKIPYWKDSLQQCVTHLKDIKQ